MARAPLKVNLLGFGTVGQALARRLIARAAAPDAQEVRIVAITDRSGTLADAAGVDLEHALATKAETGAVTTKRAPVDLPGLARRVDADVVVDALPTDLDTADAARAIARATLGADRDLVTAGKGLLALHARETRDLVRASGRRLRASAAVLGGVPALELLENAFRGDRLTRFQGVLNGSTNFILSRLEAGASREAALRDARAAGVLEADPTLDVDGVDAAAKAVILANAAWERTWTLTDAKIQGIDAVTPAEARAARAKGHAVRLVATASPEDAVSVAPVTLPRDHPLVVDGTENALRLEFSAAGAITLSGPGAGGRETAAAVLSDLLALTRAA